MWLYVPPTPQSEHGGLLGTDRVVTTCRLPLQTVGIVDIEQGLESRPHSYTKEAAATAFLPGQARSHQERAGETTRSRVHQRSLPSRVVGYPCARPEEEQQRVEDVRRLH